MDNLQDNLSSGENNNNPNPNEQSSTKSSLSTQSVPSSSSDASLPSENLEKATDTYDPAKDTKIEVLTKEEAERPMPPPAPPSGKKRSKFLTSKKIIIAVILVLVAVDIPIGIKLYQNYKNKQAEKETKLAPTEKQTELLPTIPDLAQASPSPSISAEETLLPSLSPTETATEKTETKDDLAQTIIETHSECFNNECIEVEGVGNDQCIVDEDCLQGANFPVGGPQEATPSPTLAALPKTGGDLTPTEEDLSPTTIPVPDIPAAGGITQTVLGVLAGIGILLLAVLL